MKARLRKVNGAIPRAASSSSIVAATRCLHYAITHRMLVAKNIPSARLRKLVACGIMEQVPASDGSAYRECALTQKGRELFPVIAALRQWGESHLFSRGEKHLQALVRFARKANDCPVLAFYEGTVALRMRSKRVKSGPSDGE